MHQQHLDCVAFLCAKSGSTYKPFATAFLIALNEEPRANGIGPWFYLVTARHCVEDITSKEIFIRLNASSGALQHERTLVDDWFCHDDADVAAIPYNSSVLAAVPSQAFVLNNKVSIPPEVPPDEPIRNYTKRGGRLDVKVGHEVFFTGLFVQSAGGQIDLPIARFGHVSRMPVERIALRTKKRGMVYVLVYLAECGAWGGNSGSPTFWYRDLPLATKIELTGKAAIVPHSHIFLINLLGLVTGHFEIPLEGRSSVRGLDIVTDTNAGIGLITPADCIREVLMRADVKAEREKRFKQLQQQMLGPHK